MEMNMAQNTISQYENEVRQADYETLNTIKPIDDGTGVLSGGKQICTTANTVSALGEATLTIYIEGWDHHVVNEEISHKFNLGLKSIYFICL